MSKAVSAVGGAISGAARSVSGVVSGAVKAVKSVASGISGAFEKVLGSKFGKVAMLAAAIYFGGAALSGGFGAPAGSGFSGFLEGAGAGVSNAANSLSTAWGQAAAGNFSQAGSSLSSGFQGQVAGGSASNALSGVDLGGAGSSPANMASSTPVAGGTPPVTPPTTPPPLAGAGAGAGGMSTGDALMGMAKIQAGGALIGNVMQGKAAQDQRDFELQQAQAARERYNANAGAQIFASPSSGGVTQTGGVVPPSAGQYDPMAEINAIRARRQGLVAGSMNAPTTYY